VLPGARTSSRGLCAALAAFHTPVRLIRGVQRIAALQPELAALARRCGQAGEADHLLHFLSTPDALRKTPWLLLGCDGDASSFAAAAQTPAWAALLFEYRLPLPAGLAGARLYASADSTGRRNVLAPPGRRSAAAALAAHTLITHGAHIVHIAFSETYQDSPAATPHDPQVQPSTSSVDESLTEDAHRRCGEDAVELRIASALQACDRVADRSLSRRLRGQLAWTLHQHAIPLYLPLLDTLEATLATIGQKTRANLRYYRRRAEQELQVEFVRHAVLSKDAFLDFNRRCTYAVPDAMARHRLSALATPLDSPADGVSKPGATFCAGVRDGKGAWLSLVGGRRMNGFVEIDWQMNRADLPRYSLSTVMRAFLIEDEIALGSTRFFIEGGTPHPIGHSFVQECVGELTVKRRSAYVAALERLGPKALPEKNYLAQTLRNPSLVWHDCQG
jgi:hypothetical protein